MKQSLESILEEIMKLVEEVTADPWIRDNKNDSPIKCLHVAVPALVKALRAACNQNRNSLELFLPIANLVGMTYDSETILKALDEELLVILEGEGE